MTVRQKILALGMLTFGLGLRAAGHEPAHIVALTMFVTLDRIAAEPDGTRSRKVGEVDRIRLTYDADAVDPITHRVRLLNFQHFMNGKYMPPRPDPVMMPVTDSWLDISEVPYRLHFKAAVVHGEAIVIVADENTRRLTIYRQGDPAAVLLSGPYRIGRAPLRRQKIQIEAIDVHTM
jgi:hypothetical protein